MNVVDTLRAAAEALRDRTDLAHAPALAGLLHNRADDMEHNIALWQRAGQDVPDLVEKYYGVYLTVARAVLLGYGLGCTVSKNELRPNPVRQRREWTSR
jgi:hypothetical protein